MSSSSASRADRQAAGRGLVRRRVGGLLPIVLLPPAAFAVHQLRFMLAFGAGAGAELHRTGHSYLHSVVPWLVALVGLAVGWMLRGVGRALSGQRTAGRYAVSLTGLWVLCTVALVAIYVSRSPSRGLLATGHPGGLAGIFGFGGWWAVSSAACVGLVLAATVTVLCGRSTRSHTIAALACGSRPAIGGRGRPAGRCGLGGARAAGRRLVRPRAATVNAA